MQTDELIRKLAAEATPVRRGAMILRLVAALLAGVAFSFAVMIPWLGVRPDIQEAAGTTPYWAKFAYTLALAAGAFWATERLARPGGRAKVQGLMMLVPFLAVAVLAAVQLLTAPPAEHVPLWLGASWGECPWRIVVLSLPILAAVLWAVRGMAPTRLTLAGLAAGLMAGAAGAWVYGFHCDESAMPFLALWYTLGVVVTGAFGALVARPLLRW
jgi:hypothetical protein